MAQNVDSPSYSTPPPATISNLRVLLENANEKTVTSLPVFKEKIKKGPLDLMFMQLLQKIHPPSGIYLVILYI